MHESAPALVNFTMSEYCLCFMVHFLSECSVTRDFSGDSDIIIWNILHCHYNIAIQMILQHVIIVDQWLINQLLWKLELNSGIKVMPKSQEYVADIIKLSIGDYLTIWLANQANFSKFLFLPNGSSKIIL